MIDGYITLNGKGTAKALLSNGKEEIINTYFIAENMQYKTWWESPIEGYSEQFEEFEFPSVEEIKPTYSDEFDYADGRERAIDDDLEIVKVLEEIDIEWEADEFTFSEDEPDYDYHYDRIKEEVA